MMRASLQIRFIRYYSFPTANEYMKKIWDGDNHDSKFNSDSTKANGRGSTSWQTEVAFDLKTKTNAKDKPRCTLCGKEIQEQQRIAKETIDGTQFIFDTLTCATLFKKLNTVYDGNLIHIVQE